MGRGGGGRRALSLLALVLSGAQLPPLPLGARLRPVLELRVVLEAEGEATLAREGVVLVVLLRGRA